MMSLLEKSDYVIDCYLFYLAYVLYYYSKSPYLKYMYRVFTIKMACRITVVKQNIMLLSTKIVS